MFALFLELARAALFFSSSPHMFRLRMIFSIVVLAPLGEMAKSPPVVRLATHKLILSIDAVPDLGLNFLPQPLHANTLPLCCQMLCWLSTCKDRVEPSLSLMLCPPTLIPSSDNMISLTKLPSTPAGPVASRWK